MPEYSKEQLWKIYEMLPEDLKTAIFANETAENISTACAMAGITDKRVSKVARLTGHVLMGLLPPAELQKSLEKDANLKPGEAKRVSHQIQRLILNPVKESLAVLYEEEGGEKPEAQREKTEPEKEEKAKKKDLYREPIEE